MKRLLVVLMSLILCLGSFSFLGCGKKETGLKYPDYPNTPSEKDSWLYNDEEFTIDWYVDYPWFTYENTSFDDIGKKVKEITGVTIRFTSPVENNDTTLRLLVQSDEMPDVISVKAYQQYQAQLALEGYVYPIDELAKRWAPSLTERIEEDIYNYYSIGEHLYGLPNCAYSEKYVNEDTKWEPNGAMLVRKDWYDWYVSQPDAMDITTKAGLMDAMGKVETQFETKTQKVIPMLLDEFTSEGCQSLTWLSQYFAAPFEDENGNYLDSRFTPQYLEAVKYLNEVYKAGLLSATSNDSESIGGIIARGEAFVTLVTPQNYAGSFIAAYRGQGNIQYVPLIIRNDNGDDPILQDITGYGWLLNMITKDCERPDLVIKVFDFLYSEEGQRLTNFGIENDTWRWKDEEKTEIEWTQKYIIGKQPDNTSLNNYGLQELNVMYNPAYVEPMTPVTALLDYELYMKNLKRPLTAFSYRYGISWPKLDKGSKEYRSIVTKQERTLAIWAEKLALMIKADNAETEYNNAIDLMKLRGLDDVLKFYSQAYKDSKQQAGITTGWYLNKADYKSPTLRNPDGTYSNTPVGANGDNYYILSK